MSPENSSAVRTTDGTSFEALYGEHGRAVYYLALRMLGDAALAEDATQEVFLRAFRSYSGFRGESALRTWLYRIAINHCRNVLKSWHHRHVAAVDEDWDRRPAGGVHPLTALVNRELGERIQAALDELPPEARLVLLLVADDKLSYEEVAVLTGQSVGAVRGRLYRARRQFVAAFERERTSA